MSRLVRTRGKMSIENVLVLLATKALKIARQGCDLSEIEAELLRLDQILESGPSIGKGRKSNYQIVT